MKRFCLLCACVLLCGSIMGCGEKNVESASNKDAIMSSENDAAVSANQPSDKEPASASDSSAQWADVKKITIYHGGSLDELDMNNPLVVEDPEVINRIVNSIADSDEIQPVPSDEQFEGFNSVFVDFGNGVIVSMYDDINYGRFLPNFDTMCISQNR